MKQLLLLQAQQNPDGGGDDDGDGDDDLPSDFDTLIKNIELAGNTAVILKGEWELLKKSGKNLLQKSYELGTLFAESTIPDGMNVPIEDIDASVLAIIHSDKYLTASHTCNDMIVYGDGPFCFLDLGKSYGYIIIEPPSNITGFRYYQDGSLKSSHFNESYVSCHPFGGIDTIYKGPDMIIKIQYFNHKSHISKYPTFTTKEEAIDYMRQFANTPNRQDEPIWVTPELQDTYENKGQFEFPENLPNPLRVPNIDDLQELARRLNPESNPDYNPEEIPEYIKQYINDLKVDPSPEPKPEGR